MKLKKLFAISSCACSCAIILSLGGCKATNNSFSSSDSLNQDCLVRVECDSSDIVIPEKTQSYIARANWKYDEEKIVNYFIGDKYERMVWTTGPSYYKGKESDCSKLINFKDAGKEFGERYFDYTGFCYANMDCPFKQSNLIYNYCQKRILNKLLKETSPTDEEKYVSIATKIFDDLSMKNFLQDYKIYHYDYNAIDKLYYLSNDTDSKIEGMLQQDNVFKIVYNLKNDNYIGSATFNFFNDELYELDVTMREIEYIPDENNNILSYNEALTIISKEISGNDSSVVDCSLEYSNFFDTNNQQKEQQYDLIWSFLVQTSFNDSNELLYSTKPYYVNAKTGAIRANMGNSTIPANKINEILGCE